MSEGIKFRFGNNLIGRVVTLNNTSTSSAHAPMATFFLKLLCDHITLKNGNVTFAAITTARIRARSSATFLKLRVL
jgi:hypothetical protein